MNSESFIASYRTFLVSQECPDDFIEKCCEYSKGLLDNDLPVLFDENHIFTALRFSDFLDSIGKINLCYHRFDISKKSKESRIILAPSKNLKRRQKWILKNILYKKKVSENAFGFVKNKSIKENAQVHADNNYAICLDIKDFFPSINKEKVYDLFRRFGYTKSASECFSKICCYDNCLPQGAPTSPYISNLVCIEMDKELNSLATENEAKYSRYADDITFSSKNNIENLIPIIKSIVVKHGFCVNERKTRVYKNGQPMLITGLVVKDEKIKVPKKFKRELKQHIYYCKKLGVQNHLDNIHSERFINYKEYLYGKAYYVYMIEPEVGKLFLNDLNSILWPDWCS